MKKRIPTPIIAALITLVALMLSVNANAHPGHSHAAETINGLVVLAEFIGVAITFYCIYKARRFQSEQQTQREAV
jgi:hypothetical protein